MISKRIVSRRSGCDMIVWAPGDRTPPASGGGVTRRCRVDPRLMFGHYQLLNQLGAGRDGVRFRALDREEGVEVELVALMGPVAETSRARERIKRLRLAGLLGHPTARRVIELQPEPPRPYVVLEGVGAPLRLTAPLSWEGAVAAACPLAAGLAERIVLALCTGDWAPARSPDRPPRPSRSTGRASTWTPRRGGAGPGLPAS